jgi:N-acetylmuramoyl-L-alanine amidase
MLAPSLRNVACLASCACGLLAQEVKIGHVLAVRHWSFDDVTRIAIEADGDFDFHSDRLQNPERLFFDIAGTHLAQSRIALFKIPVYDRLVKQIRVGGPQKAVTRVVLDLEAPVEFTTSRLENPARLIIEVHKVGYTANTVGPKAPSATPATASIESPSPPPVALTTKPPDVIVQTTKSLPPPPTSLSSKTDLAVMSKPTMTPVPLPRVTTPDPPPAVAARRDSAGDSSMTRVLGLKIGRIVIDPGHGGQDAGTIGPNGLREKDLVLDVSHRLGALLEERLNSEVIYARSDDSYVALERRPQIANEVRADLFISVHANSSTEPVASGVETYYLSFTTSKSALDVAARENATSKRSVFELQDLLQKIALKDKVDESREFASRVEEALYANSVKTTNARVRDRGVKKAPFVVLIGANMPSILAEIGFISNPHDEALMMRSEARQKVAEALYKGIASYAGTLSHFQVAQRQ